MRFSTPIIRQDHSQPLASISVPPAASTYRASGFNPLALLGHGARADSERQFNLEADIGEDNATNLTDRST